MKKKFFFLFLFSFFFFPFNSSALSFTDCNDVTHQVEYHNYEDFRDWCYFTYFDDTVYSNLIVYHRNHETVCLLPEIGTDIYFDDNDSCIRARSPFKYKYLQVYNFDLVNIENNDRGIDNLQLPTMDYSSVTINKSDNSLYFSSNFTFNDIKTKYNCSSSVEPDDPTPEEPEPEEPETGSTISQNDFYVLLVMLSTLIWLLYFKWCFPLTKGRDL